MSKTTWAKAKNVLAIRLDGAGDVLMTSPALNALRAAASERKVTLLASTAGARIAHLIPAVDSIVVYEAPWMKSGHDNDSEADRRMIEVLAHRSFDAAVVFTVFSQSALPAALVTYLAGIPLRLAHCRENPYRLLTDWVTDSEPAIGVRHEVTRQLALVEAIGATIDDTRLLLRVPSPARQRVASLLGRLGLDGRTNWLVAHPGATASSRRYPLASFVTALSILSKRHGLRILLTGDGTDVLRNLEIERSVPGAFSLAAQLDLGELAALIDAAPLLISNNTGPAHVAAALGTPVVVLYALTNPQHTPWQAISRVLSAEVTCKFCYKSTCPEGHHRCLNDIDPREVVAAAESLMTWPKRPEARPATSIAASLHDALPCPVIAVPAA